MNTINLGYWLHAPVKIPKANPAV